MFKHVLLPVDGSSFSELAVRYAVAIANRAQARIDLLLVHPSLLIPDTVAFAAREMEGWDRENLRRQTEYVQKLAARLRDDGVEAHAEVLEGDVAPTIIERSGRGFDLLLMATHGAGGPGDWLGSVADAVIHHVRLPALLVCPDEGHPATPDFEHILVATDGSRAAEAATQHAANLARMFGARLTLLRVVTVPAGLTSPYIPDAARIDRETTEAREREADRFLAAAAAAVGDGVQVETRVVQGYHPARAILAAVEESGVDLVAVGTHRRTRLARIVLGSVADKVLRASPVPVLIGHAIDRR